jgi:hypothetical protein
MFERVVEEEMKNNRFYASEERRMCIPDELFRRTSVQHIQWFMFIQKSLVQILVRGTLKTTCNS